MDFLLFLEAAPAVEASPFSWEVILDVVIFFAFIISVVGIGLWASRSEKNESESYFLAGRGLTWWLIGFSLIAANISTEQFVGMSGQAADSLGLAIASYEWMAAITLVVVAFFFLPIFLRSGIYTMPEFLEHRYTSSARTVMSFFMVLTYIFVTISAVIYSGAKTVDVMFGDVNIGGLQVNVYSASWIIGILAAIYVAAGGLKACAWADLLQGSALIIGGALVVILAVFALGEADPAELGPTLSDSQVEDFQDMSGADRFTALNGDRQNEDGEVVKGKMHMVLPRDNPFIPWTALVVGLWIPNFYYWGLNQYIIQRTLGAKSLGEGQLGTVFAAGLKLIIPFIVVFPGIIAFNLYHKDMATDAQTKNNKDTLKLMQDQLAGKPLKKGEPTPLFQFNKDFAKMNFHEAGQAVALNVKGLGIKLPKGESLVAVNEKVLKQLPEDPKEARKFEVQKELIGYKYDSAFGFLIKKLTPPGLRGFMFAAILGAVISSLASMLNAASTIFTLDIFKTFVRPGASEGTLVFVGRICVGVFVAIGCIIAPLLDHPALGGIFTFIQEFQGFISPGILAIFLVGFFVKRAPRECGWAGLLTSPIVYGILKYATPEIAFLDRMAITFAAVLLVIFIMTLVRPLEKPVTMPVNEKMELKSSPTAKIFGIIVVIATLALYVYFW